MSGAELITSASQLLDVPVAALLENKADVVHSIEGDVSVHRAISIMAENEVGCVMVMHGDKLVGTLSERDYTRKVILQGRSSLGTLAREIMTAPEVTVSPEDSLADAVRKMHGRRLRHLPVLDGDRLVGVLSMGDLVDHLLRTQQQTIAELQQAIAEE